MQPSVCPTCFEEAMEAEKQRAEDAKLEAKRQEKQREHAKRLREIEQKIKQHQQALADVENDRDRRATLARKQTELEKLSAACSRLSRPDGKAGGTPHEVMEQSVGAANIPIQSEATVEWDRQKDEEGQSNVALDALMTMIGLETVKSSFLTIKAKVDVVVRQGASLSDERFGAALLGNPGTGTYAATCWVARG